MTRIDMTTREWHELIKPVLPHACTDRELPELGVVRLEVSETAVYTVATDRYTIAAERWPLPAPGDVQQPIHLNVKELAASLKLFTHSKDEDPLLQITIDTAPVSFLAVGEQRSVSRLAVTVQQIGDGTRLVLHDERDPARDPLASWRKSIHQALTRPTGRVLDGLDLHAGMLSRWASAARKGERLSAYTGPEPGDPLLITVEDHFAGIWAIPQYLDAPGKTRDALPWHRELAAAAGIDTETGEVGGAVPAPEQPEPRTLIHRHLFTHPEVTATELALALEMQESDVERHLALMEDEGEAEQTGGEPVRWNAT